MNKHYWVLRLFVLWWALTFTLVFVQAGIMSQKNIFFIITPVVAILIDWFGRRWITALKEKKKAATVALGMIVFVHFLPVLLQLVGLKVPQGENIILGFVGLVLLQCAPTGSPLGSVSN